MAFHAAASALGRRAPSAWLAEGSTMKKRIGLARALAIAAASCTKQKPRVLSELDDWTEALERSSATAPNLCELADAKAARFRAAGGAEVRIARFLSLCRTRPAEWARAELAEARAAGREPDGLLVPLAALGAAGAEPVPLPEM